MKTEPLELEVTQLQHERQLSGAKLHRLEVGCVCACVLTMLACVSVPIMHLCAYMRV